MEVALTEIKEYMESWLTKRTVEMKEDHEEQLSTVKGELEASQLEVGLLNGRLAESKDLRVKLDEAHELFQSINDKLMVMECEARDLKRSREEVHTRFTETEAALIAVKRTNAILVADIHKRHDSATKIAESWKVIKATMEDFQCGEPKPLDMEALTTATPPGACVMDEDGSTNSQLQNPSGHTDRLLKRAFDQV